MSHVKARLNAYNMARASIDMITVIKGKRFHLMSDEQGALLNMIISIPPFPFFQATGG